MDRSWQNIEVDPQVELDPGDEEFIRAQLTTVRSQLILDGIPEIIDRALAALHDRFADRADPEAIIRSALADREPPWSEDETDWLLGEYQRANDLVAKVSTDDEEAAGKAHAEIREILNQSIPPDIAQSPDIAKSQSDEPDTNERSSAPQDSKRSVGQKVVVGAAATTVVRDAVLPVIDYVQSIADSPWFRAL